MQPLAKVRKQIAEAIRKEKGQLKAQQDAKKFRDALYSASESIENPAKQIDMLKQLAAQQKLKLIETDWFTAQTADLKGIGKEPELIAALFRTNPKHNPLLTASFKGNNAVYVAGSTAVKPSVPAEFKDVQDKVWSALLADYAKRAASEAAHNFSHQAAGKADAGKELAAMAKKAGAKISDLKNFTRENRNETPVRMFAMQMAVRLQDKTLSQPEAANDSMILVYLDGRIQPTAAEKAEALKQIDAMLTYSKQMMQQNSLMTWMQANIQSRISNQQEL